ncbi:MAG: hypothetical protein HN794_05955, partial [Euryarchaeota archaeon]|nr:hypothetical protein [Euryarchaeota archaeon]
MRPMRNLRILVGLMFIFTVLSPMINSIDTPVSDYIFSEDTNSENDRYQTLEEVRKQPKYAGAKAPCPVLQNDGGSQGDT